VYVPGLNEKKQKPVRSIEKVFQTTVKRKLDGKEVVLDEQEIVYPMEVTPKDEEEPEEIVEDVKDDEGLVVRRVVRRPVMLTNKVTVVKRSELLPGRISRHGRRANQDEACRFLSQRTTKR